MFKKKNLIINFYYIIFFKFILFKIKEKKRESERKFLDCFMIMSGYKQNFI